MTDQMPNSLNLRVDIHPDRTVSYNFFGVTAEEAFNIITCTNCYEKKESSIERVKWDGFFKLSMIGVPVWDAISHKWFLVTDSALDNNSWVDLVDSCGKPLRINAIEFTEDYAFYKLITEH